MRTAHNPPLLIATGPWESISAWPSSKRKVGEEAGEARRGGVQLRVGWGWSDLGFS